MAAPNTHDRSENAEPKDDIFPADDALSKELRAEDPPNDEHIDRNSIGHHTQTSRSHGDLEMARTKSIAETMSPMREFMFVGLLCSTQFVTQAGLMNTLNILHTIGPALGITNPGVLSWLVAGYSLTVGTFILLSGRAGDLFGYKNMVIFGFLWFALWNVVGACSVYDGKNGHILFIFSRVLGGIGPAILLPNALGLLGATYNQGRKKNMIFSLFGACAPGGAVIGGTFAGLWSLLWWPWTFWTFGITLAVLGLLSVFILPSVPIRPEVKNLSHKERFHELDILGATVGITAMVLVNFAVNQAPGFGWSKPYIYVLLIVGVLLFPGFFWIELKVAKKPLIPFDALSSDVIFVMICESCGWASFGVWVYYYIQFLQLFRHESPLLTMAQTSPAAIVGAIASITTGYVIAKIGPGRVMFISMLAFMTGNITLATMPIHQTYWAQAFVTILIIPWGMDMSFPAGTLIMSNAVKKEHQGMAASLVMTIVNYSISIGVGLAGTVEVHTNHGGRTEGDELDGFRGAMYLGIGFTVLGVFTSILFLAKTMLLERKSETASVEKPEQ